MYLLNIIIFKHEVPPLRTEQVNHIFSLISYSYIRIDTQDENYYKNTSKNTYTINEFFYLWFVQAADKHRRLMIMYMLTSVYF
jgi:hypothetical protein